MGSDDMLGTFAETVIFETFYVNYSTVHLGYNEFDSLQQVKGDDPKSL